MSETAEAPEKSRISKLHLGRVYNLGNYENMRVEVTVDVAPNDDPALILRSVENILIDLRAKSNVSEYELTKAQRILATSSELLTDEDKKRIPEYRELVNKKDAAMKRREAARLALSTLNYTSEHRDAKDSWEEDDDRY